MAVDEGARHDLHERLGHVLGADAAVTLMAHLPPTGWGDVVTRDHLDARLEQLDARTDRRFAAMDSHFSGIESRFARLDSRLGRMDARLHTIDRRLDAHDKRFAAIDARFDKVDARFDKVDARFDKVDERFATVDGRLAQVNVELAEIKGGLLAVNERIERVKHELLHDVTRTFKDELDAKVSSQSRLIVFSMITALVAILGLMVSSAALF